MEVSVLIKMVKCVKRICPIVILFTIFLLYSRINYAQFLISDYGDFPYEQSFLSTKQPDEISKPGAGGSATNAATFTLEGLMLVPSQKQQFGAVFINNRSFGSINGVKIEFEYMMYGGTGGDGISMYLFDSEANPVLGGAPGAGIGYSYNLVGTEDEHQKYKATGLKGAYMAVAFDAFGNFKSARYQGESRVNGIPYVGGVNTEGSIGAVYNTGNQVTIRGAALDRVVDTTVVRDKRTVNLTIPVEYGGYPVMITQSTKSHYGVKSDNTSGAYALTSTYNGSFFNISGGGTFTSTDDPAYRKAMIDLYPVPDNVEGGGFFVTVKIQHGYQVDTLIKKFHYRESFNYLENAIIPYRYYPEDPTNIPLEVSLNAKVPKYLRIGFAASTGQETDYHVIKNVRITLPGAAEAYDDSGITKANRSVVIYPLENDLAYQGTISENMEGRSDYINPASFKFHIADGSDPDDNYNHTTNEGTWAYNAQTGLVTFTPVQGFEGEASIQYSIKGGLPGFTEPYDDEAYRSLPATITITVAPDCPFLNLTDGIVYVKDYGTSTEGVRDGRTWETAYGNLADVLKAAEEFPGCIQEIWVAKGTYYPQYPVLGTTYEYYTFNLVDGVKVYGGFAGTETSVSERTDIHGINRTILSGDIDGDDNYGIINYTGSNENATYAGTGNNVFHIISSHNDITSTSILDGFTIEGGNARNEDHYKGGGIILTGNATPSLSNLTIRYNRGAQGGGGIANSSTGAVTISNVKINNNIGGESGSGFYTDGNLLILRHFDIYDNILNISSQTTGSIIMGSGGYAAGELQLSNGKVTGNNGADFGGGLFVGTDYKITNVTIADNSAINMGGGISVTGTGQGTVNNTIIWGNTATTSNPNIYYATGNGTDPSLTLMEYSIIEGSGGSLNWDNTFGNNGGNNSDTDPLFTGQGKYSYRLSTGSPAVDSGSNDLYTAAGGNLTVDRDISEELRLKGINIDMGAYEGEFLICPTNVSPDANGILYVDHTKEGNGSSWQCALSELSDALNAAERINFSTEIGIVKVRQIWVARGTYQPQDIIPGTPTSEAYPLSDRDKTFRVLTDIKLYGGFRGADGVDSYTGETAVDQRTAIHEDNETVLSGDISGTSGYDSDNVYHVVTILNDTEGVDILIDGFTITGGNSLVSNSGVSNIGNEYVNVAGELSRSNGSGIYIDINNNSDLTLNNNIIRNNAAFYNGGGVYVNMRTLAIETSYILENNTFLNNISSSGGGFYIYANNNVVNTSITVNSNVFNGNSTTIDGGGLYAFVLSKSNFVMDNNEFLNNSSGNSGGGLYLDFRKENITLINNNLIQGNSANANAGGIYYSTESSEKANINNNTVSNNKLINGGRGAGMYIDCRYSTVKVNGNFIENNISEASNNGWSNGGGMYVNAYISGNIFVEDNIIIGNEISGSFARGAGICADSGMGNITINRNVIENNIAFASGEEMSVALGGGIYALTDLFQTNASRILISYNHINKNSIGNTTVGEDDALKGGGIYLTFGQMAVRRLAEVYDSININQTSGITVVNNLLAGNNVTGNNPLGGGIHADFGFNTSYLTAIIHITNNTITSNTISASGGAGISLSDENVTENNSAGTANIYNNILWNNTFGSEIDDFNAVKSNAGSTLNIRNNLLGTANITGFTLDVSNLVGIENNPLFVDVSGTDVSHNDYNLQDESPAIDHGNRILYFNTGGIKDNSDLNLDKPRIVGGNIDAGAYEGFSDADQECSYGVVPDRNGIVYVKDYTMPGAGIQPAGANGSSWEKAHPSLADVLQSVLEGCIITEVWVAEGIYYPKYSNNGINVIGTTDSRMATFHIGKDVKVYGGFIGNETILSERPDPNPLYGNSNYISILSGDIDNNTDPDDYSSTQTYAYDMGDEIDLIIYSGTRGNSYNVVFFTGEAGEAMLNGFTVQGGNADANIEEDMPTVNLNIISGGGISFGSNSFPLLENLSVKYNQGIYTGGLSFVDFEALDNGMPNLTTPLIVNNIVLSKNISPIVSAVFSVGYLELNNFDIKNNEGYMFAEPNGTIVAMGKLNLRNGKITENKNYNDALPIFLASISEPSYRLTNVTISNNVSVNGSGLAVYELDTDPAIINGYVHNSIISGNTYEYDEGENQNQRAIVSGERNVNFGAMSSKQYIQNSLIIGSGGSDDWSDIFGNDQGGNIDTDPAFNGGGMYPYQLAEGSPAINTGSNDLYTQAGGNITSKPYDPDMAGKPRLLEDIIDMGAYESGEVLYKLYGTVFPFVKTGVTEFDNLFEVTASLYSVPSLEVEDPIDAILEDTPLNSVKAVFYDGSIFVAGTPKNPGELSLTNNPGEPINWSLLDKEVNEIDDTLLTEEDNIPTTPIGLYTFEEVPAGDYIIVLHRPGYLTRYAKVTVNSDGGLGHREIIPGDVDNNLVINSYDASKVNTKVSFYPGSKYDPRYDLNANGDIDKHDISLLLFYLGAHIELYIDTASWVSEY